MFFKGIEDITEEEALLNFEIDIYNYVDEIECIEDIVSLNEGSILYEAIKDFILSKNWKTVLERMNKWYNDLIIVLNNPDILTIEEEKPLKEMNTYIKKNHGKLIGAYPYRYNYYINQVEEYKKLILKNKMVILSFKPEIEDKLNEYRRILNEKIKRQEIQQHLKVENCKRKWGLTYYTCECGKQVQKVNKANHICTEFHKKWLLENKPNENIILAKRCEWYSRRYKCECGKEVYNNNRSMHNKTKFHQQYEQGNIVPDDRVRENNEKNETTDNIILKIEEI
jgi:hypothetical protein